MAVNADVFALVRILDEEGLGALAGLVLSEINLGREVEPAGKAPSGGAKLLSREAIADDQQVEEFVRLLRQHLVGPARALATAEVIAGRIAERPTVPIRFVDLDGAPAKSSDLREAGDFTTADNLDNSLKQLVTVAAGEES